MATPLKKGITTITWGSGGLAPWGSAIVESITYKPQMIDAEIEDNDGFTAADVLGDNGFDAEAKCVYDSAVAWPNIGDTATLKSPRDTVGKACLVVAIAEDASRKKEAMITISLKYRPNMSLP